MFRSIALCALVPLFGCAGSAAVRGDKRLPVRNVVLYRSGVGYFERTGSFDGDVIAFHVKQSEVGDFLASLTAVERTTGGVRSVSFEVPEPPPVVRDDDDEEPAPPSADLPVDVKLALGGDGSHDLTVAYVVGSPVWRPSYRVVFDGTDKVLLQAWAVVQNTSGEDWRNVKLALTTGAPISFRSDLGTPITPQRPLVSDQGEVVDYVPTGETVVQQGEAGAAAPVMAAPAPAPEAMMEPSYEADEMEEAKVAPEMSRNKSLRARAAKPAPPPPPPPRIEAQSLERAVVAQASATAIAESVTRYDLHDPVTVPNRGSTMVALLSTRVGGEQAHLYAPEPGVPLSHQHPFAVARLVNGTGAVLEKGPVSVLSNGAFLGQGLLDTVPRDAQSFVPFSLDKSLVVEPMESYSEEQGSLVRISRGFITVQRFTQRKSQYRFRNGGADATKVYVRHPRWGQAELVAPPAGTELSPDKALVPLTVPAHAAATLEVVERTPVELQLSVMDQRAADAIALYLSGPAASDPQSEPLKRALTLRTEYAKLEDTINAAEREQAEVRAASSETRDNLKAIEKLASAKDLRARLYERLKQVDARSAELTKQLIEARTRQAELRVRLDEALSDVSLDPKK